MATTTVTEKAWHFLDETFTYAVRRAGLDWMPRRLFDDTLEEEIIADGENLQIELPMLSEDDIWRPVLPPSPTRSAGNP
jgi:hypothetical protein